MVYQTYQPTPQLSHYIRMYWVLESDLPYTHWSMADACPELIFHYRGIFDEINPCQQRSNSFLSGIHAPTAHTRKFSIDHAFGMLGVYLYPHALPLLFGIPTVAITNQMVDLHSILQKDSHELEEAVCNCTDTQQRITVVETFLLKKLIKSNTPHHPIAHAIKHVIHADAPPTVRALADKFCVSERQMERQFIHFTGFNPKQFCRIARFNKAMTWYGRKHLKLSDVALSCGYYDQSHFIHDFKQFSGLSPKEYFLRKSPATEWRD